ncbi:hypothetical protein P5G65_19030 [Paenibacillus chondroitinus]|uniref:N-acetyltransferase domain-containing protein n=1 Tax=Paenibacillus chondroitinus TaxID=59842 RepID=A0ABU6DE18_9BACL|nr:MULTISPECIES: hypothetical protein [Paenibacillus]MCY9658774.1 hypothetical protein [Paenibacillus anseongense]MEB4796000.1 hypothetical protein [Paenibacillus chondroitinus]
MGFEFRTCKFEMDFEAYIRFLIQQQAFLNLPYPFAMKLAFMGSPLQFGQAMLIFNEETYDIVGSAGFVYGTGANDYEDREICQVEIAFILEQYRRTPLFLRGLEALLSLIKAGNPDVKQLQFWSSSDNKEIQPIVSRWSSLPGFHSSVVKDLTFYKFSFDELEAYCRRIGTAVRSP